MPVFFSAEVSEMLPRHWVTIGHIEGWHGSPEGDVFSDN